MRYICGKNFLISLVSLAVGLTAFWLFRPTEKFEPPPSPPSVVKVIFAGDLFFDRHLRQAVAQNGFDYPLQPLKELLLSADLAVANLESPITVYSSVSLGSVVGSPANYKFTSSPETAAVLSSYNLKVVNLGNNHILNFGVDGLNQTTGFLDKAGVAYFGNTGQVDNPARYLIKPIGKLIFGFVNYNQFVVSGKAAALNDIQTVRPLVDEVIVFAHWGTEYAEIAGPEIQTLAHQFINQGADLVIGTHPHVVQQSEVYQGKTIYYSLGNFVFDQYFSPAVRRGLLLFVTFDPNRLSNIQIREYSLDLLPDGQTRPVL